MLNTLNFIKDNKFKWMLDPLRRYSTYYGLRPYFYVEFNSIIFNTLTNRFKKILSYDYWKNIHIKNIKEENLADIIKYYKKKESSDFAYTAPDWFYLDKLYALYYKYFTHTKLQSKPISEFYDYLKDQLKDVPVPPIPPSKTQQVLSWVKKKVQRKKKSNSKTVIKHENKSPKKNYKYTVNKNTVLHAPSRYPTFQQINPGIALDGIAKENTPHTKQKSINNRIARGTINLVRTNNNNSSTLTKNKKSNSSKTPPNTKKGIFSRLMTWSKNKKK